MEQGFGEQRDDIVVPQGTVRLGKPLTGAKPYHVACPRSKSGVGAESVNSEDAEAALTRILAGRIASE